MQKSSDRSTAVRRDRIARRASEHGRGLIRAVRTIRAQLIEKVWWLYLMKQLNSECKSPQERGHERANMYARMIRHLFREWIFDYPVYRWNRYLKRNHPSRVCYRGRGGCLVFDFRAKNDGLNSLDN